MVVYELYITGLVRSTSRENGRRLYNRELFNKGKIFYINEVPDINTIIKYIKFEDWYTDKDILYLAYRKLVDKEVQEIKTQGKEITDLYGIVQDIVHAPKTDIKKEKKK